MEQVKCSGCDNPLMAGDQFCGICGTSATAVTNAAPRTGRTSPDNGVRNGSGRRDTWRAPAGEGAQPSGHAPFFEHEPGQRPGPLGNATRYLCAAAYLDRGFANRVIWELLASRRAVAPSANFEVGSVIRHCLRARRNILIRDLVLAAIVILGLFINLGVTIDFLFIAFLLGAVLPNARWKRRGPVARVMYAVGAGLTVIWIIGFSAALVASLFVSALQSFAFSGGGGALTGVPSAVLKTVGTFLILVVVTGGTQFAYTRATFRTLIEHLRLGQPPPRPASGDAEARIGVVEGAQRGNITLYGGEDPFIGAGWVLDEDWSIAIKLEPKDEKRQGLHALASSSDGYVAIDPVELHAVIAERLGRLNDPALPVNERISALTVTDRVVGSGLLPWDSPLVDRARSTPYSHASRQAIQALMRHPQAGLRYYQQISVNDEGPPVMSGDEQVIGGADQGVVVSAFVYAAVEGRMFYLQFVLTALPPISSRYRIIDLLPGETTPAFTFKVLGHSLKTLFAAVAYCPAGIFSAFRLRRREVELERTALSTDGSAVGDLGATISVRELGTDLDFGSYIRELDVAKYRSIIQRLLLETVQDFLADKGVDTSAFEGSAISIINGDFIKDVSIGGNAENIGSGGSRRLSRARSSRN